MPASTMKSGDRVVGLESDRWRMAGIRAGIRSLEDVLMPTGQIPSTYRCMATVPGYMGKRLHSRCSEFALGFQR